MRRGGEGRGCVEKERGDEAREVDRGEQGRGLKGE